MRAPAVLLLCLCLAVPMRASYAMRFAYYPAAEPGGPGLLTAAGPVTGGDADRLQAVLRLVPSGVLLAGLSLNSPGGDLEEGLRLATLVRDTRLATIVGSGAMCASACFNVFAAGPVRYASTQARIGVHSARHGNEEDVLAEAATVKSARQLALFNVPEAILGKMVAAAPDQLWWLDRTTLESMKVDMSPPVLALRAAADPATPPGPETGSSKAGQSSTPAPPKAGFRVERSTGGFSIQRSTGGFRLSQAGPGN